MWDSDRVCSLHDVSIYVGYRAYMWDIEHICGTVTVYTTLDTTPIIPVWFSAPPFCLPPLPESQRLGRYYRLI